MEKNESSSSSSQSSSQSSSDSIVKYIDLFDEELYVFLEQLGFSDYYSILKENNIISLYSLEQLINKSMSTVSFELIPNYNDRKKIFRELQKKNLLVDKIYYNYKLDSKNNNDNENKSITIYNNCTTTDNNNNNVQQYNDSEEHEHFIKIPLQQTILIAEIYVNDITDKNYKDNPLIIKQFDFTGVKNTLINFQSVMITKVTNADSIFQNKMFNLMYAYVKDPICCKDYPTFCWYLCCNTVENNIVNNNNSNQTNYISLSISSHPFGINFYFISKTISTGNFNISRTCFENRDYNYNYIIPFNIILKDYKTVFLTLTANDNYNKTIKIENYINKLSTIYKNILLDFKHSYEIQIMNSGKYLITKLVNSNINYIKFSFTKKKHTIKFFEEKAIGGNDNTNIKEVILEIKNGFTIYY